MSDINMRKIIERAKREAEQEYQEKKTISLRYDADARKIFTAEDIERMLEEDEELRGRTADMEKIRCYGRIVETARWLESHSIEVVKVEIESISASRPNVVVTIDIRRLASFKGEEKERLAAMMRDADTVFMSGIKDDVIRQTFGVEQIWRA